MAKVMSAALRDVIAERERQKDDEGWTAEHDDGHTHGEMAFAAAAYSAHAAFESDGRMPVVFVMDIVRALWRWDFGWWKPKDRRRDLVRAAALILAEIERLDRKAAREVDGQ